VYLILGKKFAKNHTNNHFEQSLR